MAKPWAADRNTWFYRGAAIVGLIAVLVGFFTTYTRPVATGSYSGPWWGHIHGALALSWTLLVLVQAMIASGHHKLHRTLGISALVIMPLWFASTVMITREFAQMTIAKGDLELAQNNALGSLASPLLVVILVGIALYLRKRPQAHKRLMFVATVLMLWPAWSRWRHYFPDPEAVWDIFAFWIALAPIPLAMLRDRIKFGAVHPALLWGGLAAIAEQTIEINMVYTPLWNSASKAVFDLIM